MTILRRKVELRRFRLKRLEDESGVSGTGYVAEGVKFSDGQCVITWLTDTRSIGIYHSPVEMMHIHGHGGKTVIEWIDAESEVGSGAAVEGAGEHVELQAGEVPVNGKAKLVPAVKRRKAKLHKQSEAQ